jgi:hypothetical protein
MYSKLIIKYELFPVFNAYVLRDKGTSHANVLNITKLKSNIVLLSSFLFHSKINYLKIFLSYKKQFIYFREIFAKFY